jgi:ABC-type branched-subunit amino acid transport system substrate-binding protein
LNKIGVPLPSAILRLGVGIAALLLAACQQGAMTVENSTSSGNSKLVNRDATGDLPALSAKASGEVVGTGPVRISMLLPISAPGTAGTAGTEMANAARMGMQEFSQGKFQLVIKDTRGQPAEASSQASKARNEGSSMVFGPLFSANVSAASGVTEPAKIPMIAFSSDIARARAGVYLLSFAADADVRRTLNYGVSLGANQVVALLPDSSYGRLAEKEMRTIYDKLGAQVVSVVRYSRDSDSMITAARSVALPLANANAIYIPEGGKVPSLMLGNLRKVGVSLKGKQIMGSGQWANVNKKDRALDGAIFAGADRTKFEQFAEKYQAIHGNRPSVTAALGYDSIGLTAELMRRSTRTPFAASKIQSRSGFRGATGIFRFESDGRLQRALVINKISSGQSTIVSPAPSGFGRTGFGSTR